MIGRRLFIATMGCKVNRADSASMAELAGSRGFTVVEHAADAEVFLLNTCTVTGKSDSEARQIVRRLHRANPSARVLVGGCIPRTVVGLGEEFDSYCIFLREENRERFVEALEAAVAPSLAGGHAAGSTSSPTSLPSVSGACLGHTRPFLKIQDGCDSFCAYCIVPLARGRSRSLSVEEVVRATARLFNEGYREVVLVGIHLGLYGRDLNPPVTLVGLLRRVLEDGAIGKGGRIRLTSLEPLEVTPGLVDFVAANPSICRHLHIPLQSGCDRVLKSMKRPYGTAQYRRAVESVKEALPTACIGADVISGFPGETVEDHVLTLRFIEASPIDYLHVFSFSTRPGTPAASMHGRVASGEIKRRVSELRALGEEKRRSFHRSMIGGMESVIVEGPAGKTGHSALTSNYIKVRLDDGDLKRGDLVDIVITDISADGVATGRRCNR